MVPIALFSQEQKPFRNVSWGMTKAEVKKTESGKPTFDKDNFIAYDVSIDNIEFDLLYNFENGKLFNAMLIYKAKHVSTERYYEAFVNISETVDSKYGAHTDQTKWVDDLYKKDRGNWGLACSAGHVNFRYVWEGYSGTNIALIMGGDNFKITLALMYTDINYKPKTTTGF